MQKYLVTSDESQDTFGLKKISMSEVVRHLNGAEWLSLDTETSGLKPTDGERLLMVQLYDGKNAYVIDAQTVDITPLQSILENEDVVKILHNVKFDYVWLKYHGITLENVYDTMLSEKVIHCGKNFIRHSLKDVLKRYLKIEMEKEVRNSFIGHSGSFDEEQLVYAVDDVLHLHTIRNKQMFIADKLNLKAVTRLENHAVLSFGDMELEGMYVNEDKWIELSKRATAKAELMLETLNSNLIEEFSDKVSVDLFGKPDFNWNSPKQVLNIFKEVIPTLESVGAPVLTPYKSEHPLIETYLDYKGQQKLISSYGLPFLELKHQDGKLHTNYSQILTTGRVSSSKPNLQQIPSTTEYRAAFEPGRDGYTFVCADFASQELAVLASASNEAEWIKILKEGGDLHSRCAELVFGEEFTKLEPETSEWKKLRTFTKTITFGISYGMGSQSLAKRLEISEVDAELLIYRYFKAFPKVKAFLESKADQGEANGFSTTLPPFSRKRFYPEWKDLETEKRDLSSIRRQSSNHAIQGSAADQTKAALIYLRRKLKGTDIKMVLTVHDEILLTCPKEDGEEARDILEMCMAQAGNINLQDGLLKATAVVSDNWTH